MGPSNKVESGVGAEGWRVHNLPIVACCPHCGTPQWFDPEALGVRPATHEHNSRLGRVGPNGTGVEFVLCCNLGRERGYREGADRSSRLTD